MKKVLFVATLVKLHINVFHIPYLEWFKKNGYEVHVVARNDYEIKEDCKIPFCDKFYDLPFERLPLNKNNIYVQKKLKNIIDLNEYDIIHCHTPMGGVLGRLAAREARKKGTKIFYTAHGFHFYRGAPLVNWIGYYPVERWLARYTDVLLTINREDYRIAKRFKASRVEYTPGVGIDIEKINEIKVDKVAKRKEINVPKDTFLLLSVGELNKNKNHEIVIRTLASLGNNQIHYVICGQGPLEEFLMNLSIELGVANQIHLLGFRADVLEIYKTCDLFIFPSHREGLSVALMEAMASGVPTVCSKIRGNSDLIEDGVNGYLLEPNDIEGFARAIVTFMKNDQLRSSFGKNNLEKIKPYSIKNVIFNMESVYFNSSRKVGGHF